MADRHEMKKSYQKLKEKYDKIIYPDRSIGEKIDKKLESLQNEFRTINSSKN